jgi:(2R)-3-sulfolactate dehydrogenase (NADP+)
VGQLFVAFDPGAFAPGFLHRIEDVLAAMLAEDGVRLPGDRRLQMRDRFATEGVTVDDDLLFAITGRAP